MPPDSSRRLQNAVYTSKVFRKNSLYSGDKKFSYKVILLDTRSNKDVSGSAEGDFLGEQQWKWFENELEESNIDLFLIGSSIQVLPTGKLVEEGWHEFPLARARLLNLVVARARTTNVLLLSGDVHSGEILHAKCSGNGVETQHIFEATSSGLSHTFTYLLDKVTKESGEQVFAIQSRGLHFNLIYNFYQVFDNYIIVDKSFIFFQHHN